MRERLVPGPYLSPSAHCARKRAWVRGYVLPIPYKRANCTIGIESLRRNQIFVCLYGRTLWPLAGCTTEENSRNRAEKTGRVFRRLQLTPSLNSLVVDRFRLSSRSIFGVTCVCHCFHCSEMAKESIYGYVCYHFLPKKTGI